MERVAIVGAAGKMGRGIALLFLQYVEMNQLVLIDQVEMGDLRRYLRSELTRFAEKGINRLREVYSDRKELVSNEEMIRAFVEEAFDRITFASAIEQSRGADLFIEAIIEDQEAKIELFKMGKELACSNALFLSNTSSIPIHRLANKSGLGGRLLGFHFYNPPQKQCLVELVATEAHLTFALGLAKELKKLVVRSADVPGFIGNGHFMREVAYAFKLAEKHSIEKIEEVTGNLLLRPMGIFSLVQFVGIGVCQNIALTMGLDIKNWEIPKTLPHTGKEWKTLVKAADKKEQIQIHFDALKKVDTEHSHLAFEFLNESSQIAQTLVKEGTAASLDDVGTVLREGFHHLYSPWEVL